MFRKLTDTLNSTLDNVKSYGSSISFGGAAAGGAGVGATSANNAQQRVADPGQKASGDANGSRFPIPLPAIVVGNGAAASGAGGSSNAPQAGGGGGGGLASGAGGFFALPALGRRSADAISNPIVVQSASKGQRGPALGSGFDTGESRLNKMNGSANTLEARTLTSEQRAASYQNIRSFEQYQEAAAHKSGSQSPGRAHGAAPSTRAAGSPSLRRSDTDELIDTDFEKLKSQLDDVLDVPEAKDDGAAAAAPPAAADSPDGKGESAPRFMFLQKIIDVIQDDRVKGGCVEAHELVEESQGRESHFVLKKVLNISFLTLGLLLFLAVISVIIYTNVASPPEWLYSPANGEQTEEDYVANITALVPQPSE